MFYFCKEGETVKPLCIILPQMNAYIKYFENGGKSMSFVTKDDDVLDKYSEIREKIRKTLNIKFHSMPVYDKKYIKAKIREFNGVINTNFLGDEITKEGMHYTCITCITIDSVMRMEKNKMTKFIEAELESESGSELECDIELELKSGLESDTE